MISQLQILYVSTRMPSHLSTGDRIRAYHLIKGLFMRGNKVTLLAFDNLARPLYESDIHNYCHEIIPIHRDDIELQQHSRARQLMDMAIGAWHGYPRHVWQFHSPDMLKVFTNLIRCNRYDIIHFHVADNDECSVIRFIECLIKFL